MALSSAIGVEPVSPKLSTADLFLAYIGAIYLTRRDPTIWIKGILDYEQEEGSAESESESLSPYSLPMTPPPNGRRFNGMIPNPARSPAENTPPSTANALSELNEIAMKKGMLVNWKEDASGPDHARTWTATAIGKWGSCCHGHVLIFYSGWEGVCGNSSQ